MADIAARADRVKGALYGMLIADAIAMPTHWYPLLLPLACTLSAHSLAQ